MGIRLLLVDDDPEFRETLRVLLTQREEAVVLAEAGSGEEALRLADALRPDVILMDLAMPRMNGLEVTRRLKAIWPAAVVVIITVHEEEAYRQTALAAGAEAFLVKKTLGVDLWPTLLKIAKKEQAQPTWQGPTDERARCSPHRGMTGDREATQYRPRGSSHDHLGCSRDSRPRGQ
jgi:DNA-binding NarL/FixJ family response regulator